MKKSIIFVTAISCIAFALGIIGYKSDVTKAINYYNTGSASEDEHAMYNISKVSSDLRDNGYEYDPTEIDADIIEANAEAISKEIGEDVDEIESTIMDHTIKTRALYLAAINEGYSVNDKEIDDAIEGLKAVIKSDPDEYKNYKAILAGEGCTEDEYWEMKRPQYETMILTDKYLDDKIEELRAKKNYSENPDNQQEVYNALKDEVIQSAIDKYGDGSEDN